MSPDFSRRDIEFNAEGVPLRGWLYLPAGRGRWPVIVMAHGFSAVKEQFLDRYAEVFARAGLAALVFDHRGFGSSAGEPRQEVDPWVQIGDYRHAVTYARTLPELDAKRLGVWGTSYSGGHVLVVGAIDRRVRCVVSQVPAISGSETARRRPMNPITAAVVARLFEHDRRTRMAGGAPRRIAVAAKNPVTPAVFPGRASWEAFAPFRALSPDWKNEVTLRSVELARTYEPGDYAPRIAPTPLLMIVADKDETTPADLALAAFGNAKEPKRLLRLACGHFEAYTAEFEKGSAAARDFFVEHLSR